MEPQQKISVLAFVKVWKKKSKLMLKSVKQYYKIFIPQQLKLHNIDFKDSVSF